MRSASLPFNQKENKMIFFINHSGQIIKSIPTPVHQGSSGANEVYLVAPFARGTVATVCFLLPGGEVVAPRAMKEEANLGAIKGAVDEETGAEYHVWAYALPSSVTKYYGSVTAQFYFYGQANDVVLATGATTFTVEMGAGSSLPDEPSAEVWEDILSNLSLLQTTLNQGAYPARAIYAWNSAYTYGANEIVYVPSVGSYGAFVKSLIGNNRSRPPYVDGALQAQYWAEVVNFNNLSEGYFNQLNEAISTAQSNMSSAAQDVINAVETRAQRAENMIDNAVVAAQEQFSEDINASAQIAVSEIAQVKQEANEQIQAMLNAFWGIFNVATVTDRYSVRETANGEQIIDGVNTNVLRISGDTVGGVNLFTPTSFSGKNGITVTNHGNGSYTFNGTASATTEFYLAYNRVLPDGKYTVSGCPSGGSSSTYFLSIQQLRNGAYYAGYGSDLGNGKTFTVSNRVAESVGLSVILRIVSGQSLQNVTFQPMLVQGASVQPFTPYFAGFKNAYFKGIESSNAEQTKEDGISLPNAVEIARYDTLFPAQAMGTRNSRALTLDGSEGWLMVSGDDNGFHYFRMSLRDAEGILLYPLAVCENHVNNLFVDYEQASDIPSGESGLYFSPNGDQILVKTGFQTLDEFTSFLASRAQVGNPLVVLYQTVVEQSSFEASFTKSSYVAYAGGTERVVQGDADNSAYGANCEITQEYLTHQTVEELL